MVDIALKSPRHCSAAAVLTLTASLLISSVATGEPTEQCRVALVFEPNAHLATVTALSIVLDDQIGDGCWPRPTAATTAAELELRRNNFPIAAPDEEFADQLILHGVGYKIGDSTCVATIALSVRKVISSSVAYSAAEGETFVRNIHRPEIWVVRTILSGGSTDFPVRIKHWFEESAEEFVLEHQKAQEVVFQNCPQMRDNMSRARAAAQ